MSVPLLVTLPLCSLQTLCPTSSLFRSGKKKNKKLEESLSLCFYYKVRTELDGALRRPKTPFINLSVRHQNLAQNSLKLYQMCLKKFKIKHERQFHDCYSIICGMNSIAICQNVARVSSAVVLMAGSSSSPNFVHLDKQMVTEKQV